MAQLKNHPGYFLRDDAAKAFDAAEAKYGKFVVNDAMRTVAQQNELIRRWKAGGPSNRPPYLYEPAQPAEASNHVKNGGIALDIGDWRRFAAIAAEFGFSHPYPGGDPVHFEFVGGAPVVGDDLTKQRQNFLNSRGWSLVVDGIEGPLTKKAYREYQTFLKANYGYTGAIDGVWGNGTQAAHAKFFAELSNSNSGFPKTVPGGADAYSWFQKALNRFGYGLVVDNKWGPKSSNALADFQRKHGLAVDRRVGPLTWAKLIA
jgi:hypothetical protein